MSEWPPKKEMEQIDDPQKWLMETGRFKSFEYPTAEETKISGVDITEQYQEMKPHMSDDDSWAVSTLMRYINAPLIIDRFSSDARRVWEEEVISDHPEIKDLLKTNKLKTNLIALVLGIAAGADEKKLLDDTLGATQKQLFEEYYGSDTASAAYEKMTIEEKVAFTKKVTALAKDVCAVFLDKYTTEVAA